ncbi:hypothetical protein C8B47_03760 [filamentous cyanobacterium CCP4]|nr:hypothetical protein C8B47_03760 [filamentous cyanobacterium CCP4]
MATPRTPTARLVDDLLEGGHERAARQVLNAMGRELETGVINQRLTELETEAQRLEEAGERLSPDNPVYRQLVRDMDDYLGRNQQRITDAAVALTEAGVEASNILSQRLVVTGMPGDIVSLVNRAWNRPDPEAVASLVDFTQDSAFSTMLNRYSSSVIEAIGNRATYGFVNGWGARRSARAIRQLAVGMPRSQAETLTRTLHLVSYRRGTAATHAANARILQPVALRVAVLDPRTCLACVALHGTEIPLGQPVRDHWQGRCLAIAQVRGFNRQIVSGEDWFNSLSPQRQAEQRAFVQSPAMLAAYNDGAVTFQDFVREGSDPLFGEMVYQQSLVGALGDDARKYYRR